MSSGTTVREALKKIKVVKGVGDAESRTELINHIKQLTKETPQKCSSHQ